MEKKKIEEIYFSNKGILNKKISEIKKDGISRLHIVSDFDRTLTRCFYNGKKLPSTIALIRENNYLTKDYPEKAFDLFNKYHPIEKDLSLDYSYRYKKMHEWWKRHEELLVKSGMSIEVIKDIAKNHKKIFRPGFSEFAGLLNKYNIPILIISSGIGNLIEEYIKDKRIKNSYILANMLEFDSRGRATGYKGKIIHILNKSEAELSNKEYKKKISKRKNIVLLGDSIEDANMADSINAKTIIKIGFLNEDVKEKLSIYKTRFDVVIVNDGSMGFVNALLKKVAEEQ